MFNVRRYVLPIALGIGIAVGWGLHSINENSHQCSIEIDDIQVEYDSSANPRCRTIKFSYHAVDKDMIESAVISVNGTPVSDVDMRYLAVKDLDAKISIPLVGDTPDTVYVGIHIRDLNGDTKGLIRQVTLAAQKTPADAKP